MTASGVRIVCLACLLTLPAPPAAGRALEQESRSFEKAGSAAAV
jgi:hypothetical protein